MRNSSLVAVVAVSLAVSLGFGYLIVDRVMKGKSHKVVRITTEVVEEFNAPQNDLHILLDQLNSYNSAE